MHFSILAPEINLVEFCTNVCCISWQLALGLVCSTTEICYSTVSQPSNSWIWWHLNNNQFRRTYSILSFGQNEKILAFFQTSFSTRFWIWLKKCQKINFDIYYTEKNQPNATFSTFCLFIFTGIFLPNVCHFHDKVIHEPKIIVRDENLVFDKSALRVQNNDMIYSNH